MEKKRNQAVGSKVRVRFAPSPTGYLHIGGARTALYNWLFARQNKGKFVLRIEDTDKNRSTEEAIKAIILSLRFLGLDWDEGPEVGGKFGPYRQTERSLIYQQATARLLASGKTYLCYCQPEELKQRRAAQLRKGLPPTYDRRCLALTEEEKTELDAQGIKPAIRFLTPNEGRIVVSDLVRGEVYFENEALGDFIIVRSDGTVTYNFAVVVDDASMQISHVIRGEDHLSNTPKQILLYQALGYQIPQFAHLPMIVGKDKTPLSKRHGAVDVGEFKKQGYLPEALLNYIALLGWSYDEATTIFSVDELIEKFSLKRVSKSSAIFDLDKLDWMNGTHIRSLSVKELTQRCLPFLKEAGFVKDKPEAEEAKRLEKMVGLEQERMKKLAEIAPALDFFFAKELTYDETSVEKVLKKEEVPQILDKAYQRLSKLGTWNHQEIEKTLRALQEELELKPKFVFQPIRVAVTGRMVSPPLFETLELLGKDKVLSRLETAQVLIQP